MDKIIIIIEDSFINIIMDLIAYRQYFIMETIMETIMEVNILYYV